MEFKKPVLNIEEQIKLLKSRGLIIQDENYARIILINISYYRLSAYMKFFQNNNDEYISGVTFNNIVELYNFDKELKNIIFENIRLVEISLRTKICLHMCTNYGSHWFYNKDNFKNEKSYSNTLEILKTEKGIKKDTFIKYYFEKYSKPDMPPFWMLTEVLSMGDLSKILNSLHSKDIKQIAKDLTSEYYVAPVLSNWMHVLATIRNICAHHSRLWNRELKIKFSEPQKIKEWKSNQIIEDKIYAVCFVLSILLKDHPCCTFKKQITELFNKYPSIDIKAMGFPVTWKWFKL